MSYQFNVLVFIIFLCAQSSIAGNSICKDLVMKPIASQTLAVSEQSYLRLIESSLQLNLISGNDIDLNVQNLRLGIYANPLTAKTPTAQSAAFKKAFDKLAPNLATGATDATDATGATRTTGATGLVGASSANAASSSKYSALIFELENILVKLQNKTSKQEEIREESTEIYDPHIYTKVLTGDDISSNPIFFTTQDGREMIAVGSHDGMLYIIDLNDPQNPVTVPTMREIQSTPTFFTTQDGREMIAVGSRDSNLYLIDINKPLKPIQIKTGYGIMASPTYYINKAGREMLAVGSLDNYLYLIDLEKVLSTSRLQNLFHINKVKKIKTKGEIRTKATYFITQNGREVLAFASGYDFHIMDLNNPKQYATFNMRFSSYSNPLHFVAHDGSEMIAVGSHDKHLYIFDLKDLQNPVKLPTGGPVTSSPTYFTSRDGREMIAVGSNDGQLYIFDLMDLQNPIKVKTGSGVESSPTYFITQTGREIIAVGSHDRYLYLIDLSNPHYPEKIQTGAITESSPKHFITKSGREMLAVGSWDHNLYLIDLNSKPDQREVAK